MPTDKRDYKLAASIALDTIEEWCKGYSRGRIDSKGENWFCSPLRNDHDPSSFSVNVETGDWHDFSTEEGGDALSLYARIKEIKNGEAYDELIASFKRAPEIDLSSIFMQLGGPDTKSDFRWHYSNGNGCSFWITRNDLPDGKKEIRPWRFDGSSWIMEKPKPPQAGFPLFNLDKVKGASKVILVEGEKTASAIPGPYVSTTWSGGSGAVKHSDFSVLRGKDIVIWPDNDKAGFKAMEEASEILERFGCGISIVKIDPTWPEKADAADFDSSVITHAIESATPIHQKASFFPLVRYGEMELKPPSWLIKGILEDDSLGSVFGPSGVGKSYLVMDMACCIASATPFHGKPIKNTGAVVYIAGEGHAGVSKRIRAWELHHGISMKEAPFFVSRKSAALCDPDFMVYVRDSVREAGSQYGRVALIVIDTWARNMAGNENDTQDTSDAIRAVDDLRRLYNCSAIIIHHSGKGDGDQSRGSSALRAALDIEYKVSLDHGVINVINTKMKDGEAPPILRFEFRPIDLGFFDEDGEPVVSAVIETFDNEEQAPVRKGKNQLAILQALEDHGGSMDKVDLIDAVSDSCDYNGFKKVIAKLSQDGTITVSGSIIVLV